MNVVFVFCKDVFLHLSSLLGSLGGGLHFNSVKGQNLGWIDLFTEKNKNSNSKLFSLVRVETNALEVTFKTDSLEDNVSSHLVGPAQPMHCRTRINPCVDLSSIQAHVTL